MNSSTPTSPSSGPALSRWFAAALLVASLAFPACSDPVEEDAAPDDCPSWCAWKESCAPLLARLDCVERCESLPDEDLVASYGACAAAASCDTINVLHCEAHPPDLALVQSCLTTHPEGVSPQDEAPPTTIARPEATLNNGNNNAAPPEVGSMADLQAECEADGGTGCGLETWLGADAATCIAQAAGMEDGVEAPRLTIDYVPLPLGRVTWTVESTLEARDDGYRSGRRYGIDASEGKLLTRSGWLGTP